MRKIISIKEPFLFKKAFSAGKRAGGHLLTVCEIPDRMARLIAKQRPDKKPINRIGISVSKKVGIAVKRSRVRRIIRAGYAPLSGRLKTGWAIVIAAKPAVAEAKSGDVQKELKYCFKKLDLMQPPPVVEKTGEGES